MATLYKQQLGAVIRRRREALGLTQRQLADRVNISEAQTISRWERGERAPTDLDAVARGLETTTEEMLSELEPVGQRKRRAMDSSDLTQLDRVEHKLDQLQRGEPKWAAELGEKLDRLIDLVGDRLDAQESAITELRVALLGDAVDGLERTRERVARDQAGTGRPAARAVDPA